MSHKESLILNMDDLAIKRQVMSKIGTLKGVWKMTLTRRRFNRSLNQNSYYHVAVVEPFKEWLIEEWGEIVTHDQAHEMLKQKILGVQYKQIAGEPVAITPSSAKLNTAEFSDYIERCAQWLAEFTGIVVLSSDLYLLKQK